MQLSVSDVMASVASNKDADRCPRSLLLFGNGDGGGGPTEDMCQALRRLAGDPPGEQRCSRAGVSVRKRALRHALLGTWCNGE
jgi:alpha-mannosidase